jgi:two-component system alkaline phosphatase synthesis response regulator PhoP
MAKKVLVIDDDAGMVKVLSVALAENGYEAVGAHDGREGMEKANQEVPDLIVLDVMMPQRSGFTVFKQLRGDDRYRDIPVIMLTAVSASLEEFGAQREDALESPDDHWREALGNLIAAMREEGDVRPQLFIEKPVDPADVVEKVRELIGE